MKDYLEALITEQINRSLTLIKLIVYPLKYSELGGLAERCKIILDNRSQFLKVLRQELKKREEDDLRDIFRDIRICTRDIALVEYYGIPALRYQTEEIGFLNKLMFKIHEEMRLPLPPPAVCCIATEHYFLNLFTNVVFAPLSESEFMLHLPDFYHEVGHYVLENRESELRLKVIKENYELSFLEITEYYDDLLKRTRRDYGPPEIHIAIERIHSQWKNWLIEFFCDLFALYTVGPAYAWAHLHLTAKRSDDIYELSFLQFQKHPSDESRMRILIFGLKNLGFNEEAKKILSRWSELSRYWGEPKSEYQYAYPDILLKKISELILDGLRRAGVLVVSSKTLTDEDGQSIRAILNSTWNIFWKSERDDFRKLEEKNLKILREVCGST
jgi:hypothetical protein